MTTNRVQAGVPTGGQFTPGAHTEAEIALDTRPDLDQTVQVQLERPMPVPTDCSPCCI